MNLQSHFRTQMNEKSDSNIKTSYKELVKHISVAKSSVLNSIKLYDINGEYGKIFNTLGKNENREAIIEAFKLLQEELERVNV